MMEAVKTRDIESVASRSSGGFLRLLMSFWVVVIPILWGPCVAGIPGQSSGVALRASYIVEYDLRNECGQKGGKVTLSFTASALPGTQPNGTISYTLDQNLSSPVLLESLRLILIPELVDFLANHSSGEELTTFYSQRREAIDPLSYETGSHVFFWLNETGLSPSDFEPFARNFRFGRVPQPLLLPIRENTSLLAWNSWSDELAVLQETRDVIKAFYLSFQGGVLNEYFIGIELYYETSHSLLLRANLRYENYETYPSTYYHIMVKLEDTSLSLNRITDNPYYSPRLLDGWVIGVMVAGGVGVAATVALVTRARKKECEGTKTKKEVPPHAE